MTINFYMETVEAILNSGHAIEEVKYVSDGYDYIWCSWSEFAEMAKKFGDYDNGFGLVEVNPSIKIVGDGWWLERHTYDGSENWSYRTIPQKGQHHDLVRIRANMYDY